MAAWPRAGAASDQQGTSGPGRAAVRASSAASSSRRGHSEAQWVEVQRESVINVCFFKGADKELPKMVNTLLSVKLSETENGKHVSILNLPGNVLIILQTTLGEKVKGRNRQYHSVERRRVRTLAPVCDSV